MVVDWVKGQVKLWFGITSTDARWGIVAIFLSFGVSFGAFAFSFWQVGNGEEGMVMIWVAWLFIVLSVSSFVFALTLGTYWQKHPNKDVLPGILSKLTDIESSINTLASEIRQERNERVSTVQRRYSLQTLSVRKRPQVRSRRR